MTFVEGEVLDLAGPKGQSTRCDRLPVAALGRFHHVRSAVDAEHRRAGRRK